MDQSFICIHNALDPMWIPSSQTKVPTGTTFVSGRTQGMMSLMYEIGQSNDSGCSIIDFLCPT